MTIVEVRTPRGDHDVLLGPLAEAGDRLRELTGSAAVPLVTDERLLRLYGDRLREQQAFEPILVPRGEAAKSWAVLETVLSDLSERNHRRGTPILSLGGGSIGDITGFAASIFKRGCPVVHIPTTLLAMVDSAVGGKTAIDHLGQKNLIGSFHLPALVIVDPDFLGTLDDRQLRSGYAEVVKYGLLGDASFFAWCEARGPAFLAGDRDLREHGIGHCLHAKAAVVAEDFEDRLGKRALLNFGHTFGHAIEAACGPGELPHGDAVAIGMVLATAFSVEQGLCPEQDLGRTAAHLKASGLPTALSDLRRPVDPDRLLDLMRRDKKIDDSGLTLILTKGIGKAFVTRGVDAAALRAFLERLS